MEADLFQEIFNVLETRSTKLQLNIQYGSPIIKIVWSSFDYMSGPELRFSWVPRYSEPSLLLDEQTDDSSSDKITSSSKQTNEELQYDDSDFLASAYECDGQQMCASSTNWLDKENEGDGQVAASTLRSSSFENTTITLNNDAQNNPENDYKATDDEEHSSYTSVTNVSGEGSENIESNQDGEHLKNSAMVTSIVDSGITGTISFHSDLSTCRSPKPTSSSTGLQQQPIDELNSCSDESDYGYCAADEVDKNESNSQAVSDDSEHLIDCVGKHATASFLNASSNVVGLSMLGGSLDYTNSISEETESRTLQHLGEENHKHQEFQTLSDEEFIAKFVLAEQICSIQFDSNPIIPKISVIPNRQLMMCSFLFCAKDDVKSMMALSIVMNENAEEWFYARERVFEEIFVDIITRFKASLLVEKEEDMICRVTDDFIEFFNLWGTLERYPLLDSGNLWKINLSKTHLMDDYMDKNELRFLYKAITGCLVCQGNTVIIGNDLVLVEKLMLTLSLFLQPLHRILCSKPYSFHYSPYLKLQGLKRSETEELYLEASQSHWPVCFIDLDRKWVSTSDTYFAQHSRKELLQLHKLGQIFKEAEAELSSADEAIMKRPPIISPIALEVDPYISNMLDAFFLLSPEQTERIAFIDHLHMNLDYKARALLQTVKELSEPAKNFKENFVSSKWSLNAARKLLNLVNDTTFNIVLARADILTNSFAEFVYQTSKLHR